MDWIGYADDIALVFEDPIQLQLALNLLDDTFSRYKLKINISKTKTMVFNYQRSETTYPSSIVKFKYLGCTLKYNEPSTGDTELGLRIDSATCKFYEISKNLMNHRIMLETRVKVMNALVRSRITYSCEAWVLTQRQERRINASYMAMLRKMVRGGYRRVPETNKFQLSNAEILARCKTEPLLDFVARQQTKFVEHVIQLDERRSIKKLLFNNSDYRKRGRQKTLYNVVVKNEKITPHEFNRNAVSKKK